MDYGRLANRFFSKEGWPSLIFIVGNILVTSWLVSLLTKDLRTPMCILIAIGLQVANTFFILSPVGEYALRVYNKGRKIRSNEINDFLTPLFNEVYSRAKKANPNLQEGITLYIKNDDAINAFSLGRKTIVVNTGTLELPPGIIKGILGHELGHISNQDTIATSLIMGGNIFVTGTLFILGKFMELVVVVTGVGTITKRTGKEKKDNWLALIVNTILFGIINLAIRAWALFGAITFTPMMRQDEYNADAFSTRLGYGEALISLFSTDQKEKPEGIIATLERVHPSNYDRVNAMKKILKENPDLRDTGEDFQVTPIEDKDIVDTKEERDSDNKDSKDNKPMTDQKAALTDIEIKNNEKKHICPKCGYELQEGSKFCPHCGFDLQSVKEHKCPDCGYTAKNEEEHFCPMCGKELQEYTLFSNVEKNEEPLSEEINDDKKQTDDEQDERLELIDTELKEDDEEGNSTELDASESTQREKNDKTVAAIIIFIIVAALFVGGIVYVNTRDDEEATYIEETEDPLMDMEDLYQENMRIKVMEDLVNIRDLPTDDAEVVGQVNKGTILKPSGENDEWYEVDYDGSTNYIKKEFVEKVEETTTPIANRVIKYKKCFTETELNEEPDILSKKLDKIREGNKVGIIEEGFYDDDNDEWYKVSYNGKVGYALAYMINE